MSGYLKTNYPLKQSRRPRQNVTREEFERAMAQYVGGSFVYIKPKRFIVTGEEQEENNRS